eukprot:TRINITY_DN75235_c0_g1_i1.p1 TRINITY_DN75235_c0_g1~~TRINITY_DN75235_c0_g1_i1.p1  ORF type:complete len:375 (-),score=42.63 TRINITY_DN75235_c0_g1_i1:104-1228(-)
MRVASMSLVGSADSGSTERSCACRRLLDLSLFELRFCWEESLLLMLDLLLHLPVTSASHEQSRERLRDSWLRHPCLRWNPVWWGCVLGCAATMLPGHLFHSALGQGGPVRPDEFSAEKDARVGWVYTYSGGFVITVLMDVMTLLNSLADEAGGGLRRTLVSCTIAICISLWYLAGDWNFLHQMRREDTMLMHAAAIGRISYGVAFLLFFAVSLLSSVHSAQGGQEDLMHDVTAMSWVLRLCFSLFMVVAILGYKSLLDVRYDKLGQEETQQRGMYKLKVVCLSGSLFVIATAILFMVAHARANGAMGKPEGWQRFLVTCIVLPSGLLVVARLMEGVRPTPKKVWAAMVAMLPFMIIGSAFTICGPELWSMLAGG